MWFSLFVFFLSVFSQCCSLCVLFVCVCVYVVFFVCFLSVGNFISLSLSLCVFSVLFLRVSMLPFSLFSGYPAFSSQIAFLSQDE